MTDHRSVQEAETAAAGKAGELTEAAIRLLLQQRAGNTNEPSNQNTELYNDFYRAYRENGVDRATARDAAADATLGLGSKDSPMMRQAEAQVIAKSQRQAKENPSGIAAVADSSAASEQQQQPIVPGEEIQPDLGIQENLPEIKAQTTNGQDPNPKPAREESREELRANYQAALEEKGASLQTAIPASKALAYETGAADSPDVAQAHREIHQHTVLKNMYQGVLEKHNVSPELAAKAADQLAFGNGSNRSAEVRKAHQQALSPAQVREPVARRVFNFFSKPRPEPQVEPQGNGTRPSTETNRAHNQVPSSVEQPSPQQSGAEPKSEAAQAAQAQPTEQAAAQNQPSESTLSFRQRLMDSGARVGAAKDISKYRDWAMMKAADPAVKIPGPNFEQRLKDTGISSAAREQFVKEFKADIEKVQNEAQQQTTDTITVDKSETQPISEPQGNGINPSTEANRAQNSASQQIWDKFGPGENGVFSTMHKGNVNLQRETDVSVAKTALMAGHDPKAVQAAIAQNSPYAKSLKHPGDYARKAIKKAELSSEVTEKLAQDKGLSRGRDNAPKTSPKQEKAKPKQKAKVKTRDKEMSY